MIWRAFLKDRHGSAGAEMALILPAILILLFGGLEAGHFVWTQHKLAEAVRDGARFAARMPIDRLCGGSSSALSSADEADIKLLTRTGQLASSSALAKVPGWTDSEIVVNVNCNSFVDTGIYTAMGTDSSGNPIKGPIITVAANGVDYPLLLNGLGIIGPTIKLSSVSHAAGIGI